MKYGSVCSGIEAASVAWESLGWEAQWYSEIEQFPSAVLAHRFPAVPNLGDMTQIHNSEHFNGNSIDILVGGTPCQSFSVAGLRKGLDDTRGQLMLTFCELAARKRPKWVVWENVPGVLSSNKGEDLASFLGLLTGREIQPPVGGWKNSGVVEGIGSAYGVAWTVLDAQYFGVAQRRRRIFAVGYLGDWRPAAAVLFEHHRLSGNPSESRKKRKATSSDAQGGSGGRGQSTGVNPDLMATLCAKDNEKWGCNQWVNERKAIVEPKASWWNGEQTAATLTKQNSNGAQRMPDKDNLGAVLQPVTHAFKVRGGSEDNTGEQGGTPGKKAGKGYLGSDELAFTIGTTQDEQVAQPIAFQQNTRDEVRYINGDGSIAGALSASSGMKQTNYVATPVPFRKARRAQSKDDHETWEQDEKTNTLNAFDTGDIRTTQAVVQPIAVDTYNQTTSNVNQTIKSPQGGLNESIGVVLQPIAVDTYNQTINEHNIQTIRSDGNHTDKTGAVLTPKQQTMAVLGGQHPNAAIGENTCPTITNASGAGGGHIPLVPQQPTMAIRRLTPTECERLQGFPDGWTKIPYRNKPEDQCPDGPRYKACGNSMAVPVMRWIGQRIQMVEELLKEIS